MERRVLTLALLTYVAALLQPAWGTPLVHAPEACQYDPGHGEHAVTRRLVARAGCSTFYQSADSEDWASSIAETCPEGTIFDIEICDCNEFEKVVCPYEVNSNWIDPEHKPHFPGTEDEDDSATAAAGPNKELGLIIGLIVGLMLPVIAGIIAAIVVLRQRARHQQASGKARPGDSASSNRAGVAAQQDRQPMLDGGNRDRSTGR